METPIMLEVRTNATGQLDTAGRHTKRITTTWAWYMNYGHPYTVAIFG